MAWKVSDSHMDTPPRLTTYRFGEFEVDVGAYSLRRGAHRLRLARQPMDVLLLLLERRQELVSHDDIARRLWGPDVFTDIDAGIRTAILKIRRALCDSSESPQFLETVPGKGYRLIAPVEVVSQSHPQAPPAVLAAPEPSSNMRRHNLPAELTSFVGRRKELLDLRGILASSRVLSLTGAGGVGKTRLALRLAHNLLNDFSDGVWLVDLAPLSDPDLVAQTIAAAIGIREGPQRSARDALVDKLRDRQLLLVLDTCEHLIAACAELVEALLREAPALRILATSREALGVSGETVCRVPSLSLPEALAPNSLETLVHSDAPLLFIERARAADTTFTLTLDNAETITRICRRLDGIPLAIELAAARVIVLSPEQIAARLQDRFRLLTDGARTAVARQRTLEATVDWSYQLLSEIERQLLTRLSVFPSSWTIEAAEYVCGSDGISQHDVLDLSSRLVNKSLLMPDGDFAGERRYRLLDTVRQYARERLVPADAADRVRQRHFEFFFEEFRGVLSILSHHDQLSCLQRLRMELENVRAALEWALTSPTLAEKGVEFAGSLFYFWTKTGRFEEGKRWLERALAVPGAVRGSVRARALIGLAHMHFFQGRLPEVSALAAEALSLGRDDGDAWVVTFALFMQGTAAFERGDIEQAETLSRKALDAAVASGEDSLRGAPLVVLGHVAASKGDHDRAQSLYAESTGVLRLAGEVWALGIVLAAAASLAIVREDYIQARVQASEALTLCEELEDPRGIAWSLEVFADLLAAAGLADGAARLWGAAEGQLENVGGSLAPSIRWVRDRHIACARAAVGETSFETARTEGRAMSPAQAIAFARQRKQIAGPLRGLSVVDNDPASGVGKFG
jgi:predicted ATPase/DNA-binding winged helix-turn-helix (wHTH) protein